MEKIEAINWVEDWASRWGIRLRKSRPVRPGERRVGVVRLPAHGEMVPWEAMRELVGMGKQLVFEEMGPPPGGPRVREPGGPTVSITVGRLTESAFRGFQLGEDQLFGGCDQLTVTGHGEVQREAMLKMLQRYLGEGQLGFKGFNFYTESWLFECGAMLNWSPGREDFSVTIRGQSMRHVGQERHRPFLVDIWKCSSYATRLDVRIDDYSGEIIRVEDFVQAYQQESWAGPRKAQIISGKELVKGGSRSTGAGVVFGTRSGVRFIVYDKGLESKGEIAAIRAELGYYERQRATEAFSLLAHAAMAGEAEFVKMVGQLVTGPIDFRERRASAGGHLPRMPRLAFWQRIIDATGKLKLKVEKAISSLMGCARAISRQYVRKMARMAVLAEQAGRDFYHVLFQEIEAAREGQELEELPEGPREMGFDVLEAFKLSRVLSG